MTLDQSGGFKFANSIADGKAADIKPRTQVNLFRESRTDGVVAARKFGAQGVGYYLVAGFARASTQLCCPAV